MNIDSQLLDFHANISTSTISPFAAITSASHQPPSNVTIDRNHGENLTAAFNPSTLIAAASTAVSSIFADINTNYTPATTQTTTNDTVGVDDGQRPERHLGWTNLILALGLCVLIVITVIGNTLVILSVLTTRRLRTVTNCFVMSLAVADWLVGIFVMPPAVALYLIGMFAQLLYSFFFCLNYFLFRLADVDCSEICSNVFG